MWGATGSNWRAGCATIIFQSTLPVWGATLGKSHIYFHNLFQSTLPVWGATRFCPFCCIYSSFQSTLPVWGATVICCARRRRSRYFNPRSPCGERPFITRSPLELLNFNPRSPCGERPLDCLYYIIFSKFQSTLPVWGATYRDALETVDDQYFNPRSPCGERPDGRRVPEKNSHFNPRSPCGERPLGARPLRRALGDFNPRSLCGERRRTARDCLGQTRFQSTLPVWRATQRAPAAGTRLYAFQSTLPVWGATR